MLEDGQPGNLQQVMLGADFVRWSFDRKLPRRSTRVSATSNTEGIVALDSLRRINGMGELHETVTWNRPKRPATSPPNNALPLPPVPLNQRGNR